VAPIREQPHRDFPSSGSRALGEKAIYVVCLSATIERACNRERRREQNLTAVAPRPRAFSRPAALGGSESGLRRHGPHRPWPSVEVDKSASLLDPAAPHLKTIGGVESMSLAAEIGVNTTGRASATPPEHRV
jgi:hypothetical protein